MKIEIQNATRKFGTKRAVDNVTLSIKPGERLGILGPNGSGKTTLIQLVLGFLKTSEGAILIDGMPVWPNRYLLRRRIGALIEIPLLYPALSAKDNLLFFARFTGADTTKIDSLLKMVHLDPAERKPFSTFSLGMKQRLGIALALLNDPELLIFDEPTNGLDPEGIVQIREIIKSLTKAGKSVILCSHLLPEVEQICESVAILQNGKVLAERKVQELNKTGSTFNVVLTQEAGALEAFSKAGFSAKTGVNTTTFSLDLPSGRAPADVLKTLIAAGLEVEEFVRTQQGLESFFLELMEAHRESA